MDDIITTTEELNELWKEQHKDAEDWANATPFEQPTLNNNQIADLQNRIKLALCESVGVLYFDDVAYYGTALWKIVEYLGGKDAVELLERDEQQAFQKYCRDELNG